MRSITFSIPDGPSLHKPDGSVINPHSLISAKCSLLSSHGQQSFPSTVESLSVPSLSFPSHSESSDNEF